MAILPRLLLTGRAGEGWPPEPLRTAKRTASRALSTGVVDPVVRRLVQAGVLDPQWTLLETRGRRTGQLRVTPVGNGLRGDTFWIITEHGWHAAYVRNIEAEPRVRVRVGGRWRSGVAHVLPDEDPYALMRTLARPANDLALLLVGTEQLVIRVDLEPLAADEDPAARR